jgi:hypothetical protein
MRTIAEMVDTKKQLVKKAEAILNVEQHFNIVLNSKLKYQQNE